MLEGIKEVSAPVSSTQPNLLPAVSISMLHGLLHVTSDTMDSDSISSSSVGRMALGDNGKVSTLASSAPNNATPAEGFIEYTLGTTAADPVQPHLPVAPNFYDCLGWHYTLVTS